jgi:sulfoxide reductase heme-binding subunit YedZ
VTRAPAGWAIVGWSAAAIALVAAVVLAAAGTGEPGIRMVIRATARTSVVLFTAAFVASSVHRAWPGPASRWLVANRRYLGVSFAVSHFGHLLAILALAGWSARKMFADAGPAAAILGGIAYLLVAAMTATSFDRTAAWLGARRWRRLHAIGVWWLWVVFFASFAPRAFGSPLYVPFALLLAGALVLRVGWRPRAAALATRVSA